MTRFCSKKCRQTAHRVRRRGLADARNDAPGRFAYADPPYPGKSFLYRDQATYGGEVDHAALIDRLEAGGYMGWALSTSAEALLRPGFVEMIRSKIGADTYARTCAWVKPIGAAPATFGLHNVWEPLIVVRGRQERPGKRDMLIAQPARFGGDLIGRKPIAFAVWLFQCLGMKPGDTLDDLFPGTGVIAKAWAELAEGYRPSPRGPGDDERRADAAAALERGHWPEGHSMPGTCGVCGHHACYVEEGVPRVLTCPTCKTACPCECGDRLCESAEVAEILGD